MGFMAKFEEAAPVIYCRNTDNCSVSQSASKGTYVCHSANHLWINVEKIFRYSCLHDDKNIYHIIHSYSLTNIMVHQYNQRIKAYHRNINIGKYVNFIPLWFNLSNCVYSDL